MQTKKSDLGIRALSAVVMAAFVGTALWLGGWWWTILVAAVALGVLWEWRGLVSGFGRSLPVRLLWNAAGIGYVGLACVVLLHLRAQAWMFPLLLILILAVIATDIGAYCAGRTIGGPKIAAKISPSKTWAGLAGGIVAASMVVFIGGTWPAFGWKDLPAAIMLGVGIAVVAQAGDFFESSMKRRAGVKDSGALIPGHGGLFDRVDGLLAVLFAFGIAAAYSKLVAA